MNYPWELSDRFNAAFPNMRGMTLNTPPVPMPMPRPPEAEAPFRLYGSTFGPRGPSPMTPQGQSVEAGPIGTGPAPYDRPAAFPAGGVAPVPNVAAPQGPGGISLNSTPTAPGWAGTVGIPAPPVDAKSFQAGSDMQKALGGLEEVAKGLKGKESKSSDLNTITPMSSAPLGGGGNQMGAELLGQLLAAHRRNYGVR